MEDLMGRKPRFVYGNGAYRLMIKNDSWSKTRMLLRISSEMPLVVKMRSKYAPCLRSSHPFRGDIGQLSREIGLNMTKLTRRRDDLTVQVIFFGNGPKTGTILVNEEASNAPQSAIKAKL